MADSCHNQGTLRGKQCFDDRTYLEIAELCEHLTALIEAA